MTLAADSHEGEVYLNPVYGRSCPDPFILKFGGEYWCYSTGLTDGGRAFGVLHSRDLVHWRDLGGAMEPLPGSFDCYWAPEVVYDNGRFLMYYSVGDGVRMEIRVAVAEHPAGLFVDSGRRLTSEEFAIDAHVFVDRDGTRYLFYATDFLEHTHIGTGTVQDLMLDPFRLAGQPRPVTRARFDWQVYDPARREKGGVRWHTVEGPYVLRRKGLLYQMFSGGNWQNLTYGVSYATSPTVERADEWEQFSDGVRALPILRTIPGLVTGPGHNSVVRAPDNRQLFCVYHRWTENTEARVLSIDRMEWIGERLSVLGPTTAPVRAPLLPLFADFFEDEQAGGLGEGWDCTGGLWRAGAGEAAQSEGTAEEAAAVCRVEAQAFLLEVSLRAREFDAAGESGSYGVGLLDAEGRRIFEYSIVPQTRKVVISWQGEPGGHTETLALPEQFNPQAFHLLQLEADGSQVCVTVDENFALWRGRLNAEAARACLLTRRVAAGFRGFSLTGGWQHLFEEKGGEASVAGWQNLSGDTVWSVHERQLRCEARAGERAAIGKLTAFQSYEMVVNARLVEELGEGARLGFYPALGTGNTGVEFALERNGTGAWALQAVSARAPAETFTLPASFNLETFQQFRFTKERGEISVQLEATPLGSIRLPEELAREATSTGLFVENASAAFEMVRVTAIGEGLGKKRAAEPGRALVEQAG